MLFLKCPPPQHNKRFFARWIGLSLLLHGLLLVCALGVASMISVYVPAQSGSAITVSLVGMGSTAAGGNTLPSRVESTQASTADSGPAAVQDTLSPAEPKADVPIKRKDAKPKSAAKPVVEKADILPRPHVSTAQSHAQPADADLAGQGSGGNSSVNSGSGLAEQALGSVKGEASPQMQAVAWNAPGGRDLCAKGLCVIRVQPKGVILKERPLLKPIWICMESLCVLGCYRQITRILAMRLWPVFRLLRSSPLSVMARLCPAWCAFPCCLCSRACSM